MLLGIGRLLIEKKLGKKALLELIKNLVAYTLPSCAVYYIFYVRNRKYLNSHEGVFEKNLGNFYDYRSEIAMADM